MSSYATSMPKLSLGMSRTGSVSWQHDPSVPRQVAGRTPAADSFRRSVGRPNCWQRATSRRNGMSGVGSRKAGKPAEVTALNCRLHLAGQQVPESDYRRAKFFAVAAAAAGRREVLSPWFRAEEKPDHGRRLHNVTASPVFGFSGSSSMSACSLPRGCTHAAKGT